MKVKRGGGQLITGQILLYLLCVLIGLTVATQYAAYQFHYHRQLGEPLFRVGDYGFYPVYKVAQWLFDYYSLQPTVFFHVFLILAGSVGCAIALSYPLSLLRERTPTESTTYGSSRFAAEEDIANTVLLDDRGVFLAKLPDGRYLRHDGPENIWVIGPPRKGKGVGLIIPTALSWTESAVIYEVRSEAWSATSGFRSQFSHSLYFNPIDIRSVHFNPLMEVRAGINEVRDVQNIADILVDPTGKEVDRSHWKLTSFQLLVGVILHVLYAERDKSLHGVASFLSRPGVHVREQIKRMLYTPHLGSEPHPEIAGIAQEVLNKPKEEFGSLISTTLSYLSLYRDPIIATITRSSDFRLRDLMHGERPLSLYLSVPPSDSSRTRPLFRLMINQIIRALTEDKVKPGEKHYKHRLLLLLDEFPELGRLDALQDTIAFLGGYGIKTMLAFQGLDQLDKAYGPNHSFASSIDVKVVFAANDMKTAKMYSDQSGTKTEQRTQTNYAGDRMALWLSHKMVATQETSRPLMTAGEILQLPPDECLVFMSSVPPIKAVKFRYFDDPLFTKRCLPEVDLSQGGEHYPDAPNPMPPVWSGVIAPVFPKEEEEVPAVEGAREDKAQTKGKKVKTAAAAAAADAFQQEEIVFETTAEEPEPVNQTQRNDADDDLDNLTAVETIDDTGWTI